MEVAVGVLLFEDDTYGLFDIDEETPGCSWLLVVRHTPWARVRIFAEYRPPHRIVAM